MSSAITVYDGPMVEWTDSTYALATFPHAVVEADDDVGLLEVLNRGLAAANDDGKSARPWGRPLAHGDPVWLDFADPSDDPAEPRTWATQTYFFGVGVSGELLVQDWFSLTMTVGDLRRAGESGYLPGEWDRVVVLVPEGLGGGPDGLSPFVDFLRDVGVDIAVGAAAASAASVRKRVQQAFDDRRARKVIEAWHEHGIEGPWVLGRWADVKPAWDAEEVATRLGLERPEAESLLEGMGYEYSERAGAWTVGTRKKATKRRSRWDEGVTKEWQRPRRR